MSTKLQNLLNPNSKKLKILYKHIEKTGVIATLEGAKPGKTIALRSDIDALPIYMKTMRLN